MNNLRLARDEDPRNLTQQDMADFLGIQRSTYGKYETGDSEPNFDTLCRLSDFFNLSVEYLMGRTNIKKPPTSEDVSGLTKKQLEIIEMMDQMTPEQQTELVRQAEYQLWMRKQKKDNP